jgi:transcriptional regulator with GAF, ATPase, and Fis domain
MTVDSPASPATSAPDLAPSLVEKRRVLQLETLYDLALALGAKRPEQELVDELLQRVCAVLDPAGAVAVTRDAYGAPRAVATVGWRSAAPSGESLLSEEHWQELLRAGRLIARSHGEIAGRSYEELLAAPIASRGLFLGYLAVLDKETRAGASSFSEDDRRFLDSVAALAGASLDNARQRESLEAQRERLAEENRALRGRFSEEVAGHRIVATAPSMRRALEMVERVAPFGVNVVVRGESGTGKELVAKLLHHLSGRTGSLIALNCAALPESLLESELFGIEGGVATGVQARVGKFELADGGTLFLDEIGDMQPAVQVKLLRAIQEREVVRVGGHRPIRVDVRLVAATHRDLEDLVEAGGFREDLYYRLKGVEVDLPPLRERREDMPHLVRHFLEEFCRQEEIEPPLVRPEALELLMSHDYPGNVRELQNVVQGAVSLVDRETGEIDADLVRSMLGASSPPQGARRAAEEGGPLDLASVERRHIERVLETTGGNKTAAARVLGITRRTLQRKGF